VVLKIYYIRLNSILFSSVTYGDTSPKGGQINTSFKNISNQSSKSVHTRRDFVATIASEGQK
jgi:hypothetical protein